MKRLLARLCVTAVLLGLVIPAVGANAAAGGNSLSKRDRQLLSEASVQGDATVTVLIAAAQGKNKAAADAVTAVGGTVRVREDSISYLRAIVPINAVAGLAKNAAVAALDVDEIIPLEDPRPDGTQEPTPQTPPGSGTPNNNPYMPIGDTGASQFVAAHPTWDGRGVVVGILDTGITLDHPSLLTTSTGERKIIDWVTYTDPFDDDDPTWVNMSTQVNGPSFMVNAKTYTAPEGGAFRFGLFVEGDLRLGGEVGRNVNRDNDTTDVFAVLWQTNSNKVWVDTNQDLSFANETAMTDYKVNFDVGYFGTDNPATAVAERMPFVVQTDGKNKVINIGIVSAAHGSHVAGIVAGHSLFGGAMSGAAPGAQIVSVRVCLFISGCTAHALVEGMIYAAKQSNVDVINMSIGGLPALNDGNNARARLYDRLIETYKVQIFISAGNSGSGLNTVGDPSVASKVMSIGTYISKDTWQKDYGSDSEFTNNMHGFSSRGPREDGGFKPNVIAPGAAVSTTPMWQPGGPVAGTYTLPPGYSMFNGTSMSSPQAAGAAALLVSAAQQTGAQHQPAQIRQAFNSSARFIDRYQAYEQGNGLINVGAAWDLLETNIDVAEITGSVPVNTLLSGFLATPGVGLGIHDREGVTIGTPYTRTYTFTRTKGGSQAITYDVSWVGNDDTFSSPTSISLPANQPVNLNVTVNPATAGAHSAILNLDNPATAGIDYQTMNVVVAPDEFNTGNGYAVAKSGTIGRNQTLSHFFDVPIGVPAFKVDFSGPSTASGTGQARFLRYHPYGVNIDSNASTSCYIPSAGSCAGSPSSRSATDPQAGVWETTVEARRTSDTDSGPYTLTASILGVSVAPNPDIIPSATIGVPVARTYTLTNLFGAFTGGGVGTTLGSAFRDVPTIANLGQQVRFVTVTAGSTSLRATIGGTSDLAADLDLYLFDCTAGPCVLAGLSADGDSEESVTIADPATGLWAVLVDGFAVPAGTTTYNYVDVFLNAAFGSVTVTDANALRPVGASWTVPGSVTAAAGPGAGRVLLGNVEVRTDTNVLVGSGDVIIQSVAP